MLSQTKEIPGLKLIKQGKVRDIYAVGENELLLVASDRISAFDVILPTLIPDKGSVLTKLSKFWFEYFKTLIPSHCSDRPLEELFDNSVIEHEDLLNRSMRVVKAAPLPVEAIVRGYISGSGWKEYQSDGKICGIELKSDLQESDKLSEPIFTPSTKAEIGEHDENISFDKVKKMLGEELANKVKDISIELYTKAEAYARARGIIIADTKFEFGLWEGQLILIDEVLTPDSSRFWPLDLYTAGKSQASFDKQYVRDWLINSGWDKKASAPELPDEVVKNTTAKYQEVYKKLTN